VGQRVTAGLQGVLNIGEAGLKTFGSVTLGAASIAAAPETLSASLLGLGVAGYGTLSSVGQATSGSAQLVTAFTGDVQAGEGMQQVGDIMSRPLTGIPTLAYTSNPQNCGNGGEF
jgi:hypothetical protein